MQVGQTKTTRKTHFNRNGLPFLLIIYNINYMEHNTTLLMFELVLVNDLLRLSDLFKAC
jgi:hypothetical protein